MLTAPALSLSNSSHLCPYLLKDALMQSDNIPNSLFLHSSYYSVYIATRVCFVLRLCALSVRNASVSIMHQLYVHMQH